MLGKKTASPEKKLPGLIFLSRAGRIYEFFQYVGRSQL
jgi:hypothetical protein